MADPGVGRHSPGPQLTPLQASVGGTWQRDPVKPPVHSQVYAGPDPGLLEAGEQTPPLRHGDEAQGSAADAELVTDGDGVPGVEGVACEDGDAPLVVGAGAAWEGEGAMLLVVEGEGLALALLVVDGVGLSELVLEVEGVVPGVMELVTDGVGLMELVLVVEGVGLVEVVVLADGEMLLVGDADGVTLPDGVGDGVLDGAGCVNPRLSM